MSEQLYRAMGWGIFIILVGLGVFWSLNEKGIAGFIMEKTQEMTGHKLTQLGWILTLAILGLPGWMIKNYFEGLAWNAHVESLPPPDIRESAKKSKYIRVEDVPPAPVKPVKLDEIAKGQEEFIATCPACGNFFSAKKSTGPLKCPSCGEQIPVS